MDSVKWGGGGGGGGAGYISCGFPGGWGVLYLHCF